MYMKLSLTRLERTIIVEEVYGIYLDISLHFTAQVIKYLRNNSGNSIITKPYTI